MMLRNCICLLHLSSLERGMGHLTLSFVVSSCLSYDRFCKPRDGLHTVFVSAFTQNNSSSANVDCYSTDLLFVLAVICRVGQRLRTRLQGTRPIADRQTDLQFCNSCYI